MYRKPRLISRNNSQKRPITMGNKKRDDNSAFPPQLNHIKPGSCTNMPKTKAEHRAIPTFLNSLFARKYTPNEINDVYIRVMENTVFSITKPVNIWKKAQVPANPAINRCTLSAYHVGGAKIPQDIV